jgi:hypothetical protein
VLYAERVAKQQDNLKKAGKDKKATEAKTDDKNERVIADTTLASAKVNWHSLESAAVALRAMAQDLAVTSP